MVTKRCWLPLIEGQWCKRPYSVVKYGHAIVKSVWISQIRGHACQCMTEALFSTLGLLRLHGIDLVRLLDVALLWEAPDGTPTSVSGSWASSKTAWLVRRAKASRRSPPRPGSRSLPPCRCGRSWWPTSPDRGPSTCWFCFRSATSRRCSTTTPVR